jgi:hypothetical protein
VSLDWYLILMLAMVLAVGTFATPGCGPDDGSDEGAAEPVGRIESPLQAETPADTTHAPPKDTP